MIEVPAGLAAAAARGPDWAAWVDALPRRAAGLLSEWDLRLDGAAMHGYASLVLPVLADGGEAVLKIGWQDRQTEHEALGLQRWNGDGAVRLLRADPRRGALLLERLGEDVSVLDDLAACEAVAELYGRLHRPAGPPLHLLSEDVAGWTESLAGMARDPRLPRRVVQQAVALGRDLSTDPDTDGTMIHADLHYANVLASERGWLAIDPHTVSGDPTYEVSPLLTNRWGEVVASGDVRAAVRRRFFTTIDAAGFDEDRARSWVVAREAWNAMWAATDGDDHVLTVALAVIKAVQD